MYYKYYVRDLSEWQELHSVLDKRILIQSILLCVIPSRPAVPRTAQVRTIGFTSLVSCGYVGLTVRLTIECSVTCLALWRSSGATCSVLLEAQLLSKVALVQLFTLQHFDSADAISDDAWVYLISRSFARSLVSFIHHSRQAHISCTT